MNTTCVNTCVTVHVEVVFFCMFLLSADFYFFRINLFEIILSGISTD